MTSCSKELTSSTLRIMTFTYQSLYPTPQDRRSQPSSAYQLPLCSKSCLAKINDKCISHRDCDHDKLSCVYVKPGKLLPAFNSELGFYCEAQKRIAETPLKWEKRMRFQSWSIRRHTAKDLEIHTQISVVCEWTFGYTIAIRGGSQIEHL